MKKGYRDYIYGNYTDTLEKSLISKNQKKERELIYKYFKKNYLPYFPKNKDCRILDMGCGFGEYLRAVKRCGYNNILGVDTSVSIVEYNRKQGIKCIHSDAKSFLEHNKNSYDVVLFNDVIEHFKKEELFEVLELLREALRSGGRVIIKTGNMSNPVTGGSSRYFDLTHEVGFTEVSMRQMLLAADFAKVKIIGADIYVCYLPFAYVFKLFAKVINSIWFFLNCLYGRATVKIYEKNIIAIAYKK